MDASFYFSIIAILISLASFGWSIHIGNRDKGKLLVKSELYSMDKGKEHFIRIKAVNYGRRPIILTTLWARYSDNTSSGTIWQEKRLNENEKFEEDLTIHDLIYIDEDGNEKEIVDYYLEDTVGRTYKIKNIREHLKRMIK